MAEQKNTVSGKVDASVLSKIRKLLMLALFLGLMFVTIYTMFSDKEIRDAASRDYLYERWQSEPKEPPIDEYDASGGHISFD